MKCKPIRKCRANPLLAIAAAMWLIMPLHAWSQTTDVVILNSREMTRVQSVVAENAWAKNLYDSIVASAQSSINAAPAPLEVIYYEGLLDTDARRIATLKSLADIDNVVNLIYSYYGDSQPILADKAAKFVLAWAEKYLPTGNTINENKLVPLFWAYYLFRKRFSADECVLVEKWMMSIARAQLNRLKTPMNNWEAKRMKIIATVGCILDNDELRTFAVQGFKNYIHHAYYPDGTSNDLKQRDALSYHVSGLTPCIALFATCAPFDRRFDLFNYEAPSGASIVKAVEYTRPYATGEATRKEWINTKVDLDKRRAAAGIPEYQPGLLFNRAKAIPMLEWACYFNADWCALISSKTNGEATTWVGLLNGPLIRG